MAKRSVEITLVNNTPFTLTEFFEYICHGSWSGVTATPPGSDLTPGSPGWTLPATIGPNETVTWSSADAEFGIATGTQGYAKYTITTTPPYSTGLANTAELLFVTWDNPYAWADSTIPIVAQASLADISAPCGDSSPSWPPWGTSADPGLQVQAFITATGNGSGLQALNFGNTGAEVWDYTVAWLYIGILGLIDAETDVNLHFAVGLRQLGSVGESIRHFYNGKLGLRALAAARSQPSLRALFAL